MLMSPHQVYPIYDAPGRFGIAENEMSDFDLEDAVDLFSGVRGEEFPHERVIRLFQLQTWIWYPGNSRAVEDAARIAATQILHDLEFQKFPGRLGALEVNLTLDCLNVLSKSDEYRELFDAVIAPGRGWSSAVIQTVRPDEFDKGIDKRSRYGPMIADLIDYRLRAVLQGRAKDESNISHAIFFNWWPNRKPSPRTRFDWWGWLKPASGFIFLIEKHRYPMRPPAVDDDRFLERLLKPPISKAKLRSFFSEYAFVTEQWEDEDLVTISAEPAPVATKPFSPEENAVIDAYKAHYLAMNEGTYAQTGPAESPD
jgi:hypothetical protein